MKKLLLLSISIMIAAIISGCVGDKNSNQIASTNSQDDKTQSNPGTSPSKVPISPQDQKQAEQKVLMQIEHFIDPKLSNFPVQIDNKNIELVSYRVNDTRKYEKDPYWSIELVVQNNAKTPVWVIDSLLSVYLYLDRSPPTAHFVLLDSGERKRYFISGYWIYPDMKVLEKFLKGPRSPIPVDFPAYNTVKPKISPEFKNFKLRNINFDLSRQGTVS